MIGLFLLGNESSIKIWNEFKKEWVENIEIDKPIIAIYSISESASQKAKIICITKASIETWIVDHSE